MLVYISLSAGSSSDSSIPYTPGSTKYALPYDQSGVLSVHKRLDELAQEQHQLLKHLRKLQAFCVHSEDQYGRCSKCGLEIRSDDPLRLLDDYNFVSKD